VRRDLLGTHSLEESLHVVELTEDYGVLLRVVGMLVPLLHLGQVSLVEALSVLLLVNRLGPAAVMYRAYSG